MTERHCHPVALSIMTEWVPGIPALMEMDFAVMCPLVPKSGVCPHFLVNGWVASDKKVMMGVSGNDDPSGTQSKYVTLQTLDLTIRFAGQVVLAKG